MSKVYVVWGFTDGANEDSEVLGIFSLLALAEARMMERTGDEEWESQSITAHKVNDTGPDVGAFIKRVEVKHLPLQSFVDSDDSDGSCYE